MRIPVQIVGGRNVDDGREMIFQILRNKGDKRVIYFHGWDRLGASVVLRSIAEVLPYRRTTPELCFDKIIHIDCSDWKNRRGLQRAIAEELELESSIMAILDKQDEEDDFNGVDESSRNEITSVSRVIHNILKNSRFVLIFHNGSDNEIVDLVNFGVPSITSFGDNVMIWTYKRRMLTIKKYELHELLHELRYTHLLLLDGMKYLETGQLYALLCKEADIIVAGNPCTQGVNPMVVVDCCLYKLFLQCGFHKTNSDWDGLASSYWICDGILPKDITLEISDALHREIRWECDDDVLTKFKKHFKLPFLIVKEDDVYEEGPYRWISITSRDREILGMKTLPAETSSFFLEFQVSDQPTTLPNGLFEHSSNLGVLTLYSCAFNFASPPFLKCQSLRFLGLDHCTDDKTGEGEDHTEWVCLHSLWVLDLRYTVWNEILSQEKLDLMDNLMELSIEGVWCWQYTTCLQGRLPNLQRLRVIKPTRGPYISTDPSNSFMDKEKLEILDLSGNNEMEILPNSLSKASSLQVLILDGCNDLKNVLVPDGLPHLLKSFRFDGYGPASHRAPTVELPLKEERPSTPATEEGASISNISLKGCSQLENLFVRGLPNLVELDLSGTAIKTLDFRTMVLEVPMLKRLFLLGCEHLRAIIWSTEDIFRLNLLCIDTRAGTGRPRPCIDRNKSFQLEVHAIVVDARLARSLWNLLNNHYTTEDVYLNIHVTSAVYSGPIQSKVTYKEKKIAMYGDQVSLPQLVQADRYSDVQNMVGDAPMQAFPKPPTNNLDRHIEIAEGSHAFDSRLGELMKRFAESLHGHDVSASASFPKGYWRLLRQCRMERCPKLVEVFPLDSWTFEELETFWASDLLMARWICGKGFSYAINDGSFRKLQHLQLRSCPRLQFVLPVWFDSFPSLETLHIIHCGHLRHIFVLIYGWYPEKMITKGVAFPKLTTIHLHDLPELEQICEVKMLAPELKTIKIRGCWGLRRLPVVGARRGGMKKPTVEIEKDVWDALEWDGRAAPDHFEAPLHSRYYKKKLPRVSVLR